jgi:hypothetical protein
MFVFSFILAFLAAVADASPAYPTYSSFGGRPYSVTYDNRSLMLNGQHALFISGSFHPPRGTPEMWKSWFANAKRNGLNAIEVYIFWNFHEPTEGNFTFSNRGNLTLFMEDAAAADLFVNLRIGFVPFSHMFKFFLSIGLVNLIIFQIQLVEIVSVCFW